MKRIFWCLITFVFVNCALADEINLDTDIHQWLEKHQCEILAETVNASGFIFFSYQDIAYTILYNSSDSDGYFILDRIISFDDEIYSELDKKGILKKYVESMNSEKSIKVTLNNDNSQIWILCEMYTFGNNIDPIIKRAIKNVNNAYDLFKPFYKYYLNGK